MSSVDIIFYGKITGGVVVVGVLGYFLFRRVRKHGGTHKPHVMNKINDFYTTQDIAHGN